MQVRYRTLAARAQGGSIAVFPTPHKYFMPRDFTTNMGFLWHTAWRGQVYLGVRQLPDDNSRFYPWMNAPPGTEQRMNVFFLLSDGEAKPLLDEVTRYTNRDKFPEARWLRHGRAALALRLHRAGHGKGRRSWVPPFKPVLKDMGVDAAIIADFHGDGHPQDQTELRLKELKAYFDYCRAQSGQGFPAHAVRRGQCSLRRPLGRLVSEARLLVHGAAGRQVIAGRGAGLRHGLHDRQREGAARHDAEGEGVRLSDASADQGIEELIRTRFATPSTSSTTPMSARAGSRCPPTWRRRAWASARSRFSTT